MKEKNRKHEDDGRTIANMNVEGMPWYRKAKNNKTLEGISLNKLERKAIILGSFSAVMPIIIVYGVAFLLIYLFLYFIWL